jgi:putative intracellular protease/amidase
MSSSAVHLFVFDTMADWEPAFAIAAINNPQFQLAPDRYRVTTVAATNRVVTTMGGLRILPDLTLDELVPAGSSMLILPGGETWETTGNPEAIDKARSFLAAAVPVAAICGATFALALAGILDRRRHTSNAPEYLASSGYRGTALYCDQPAVADRNLITAAGTAPVDFACEIFKALNLYPSAALAAWYALFKHGDASRYYELPIAS